MNIASALSANLPTDDWKLYEYKIKVTLRNVKGKNYSLAAIQIDGLLLEKDYDNDHLPVIMLDLDIPMNIRKNVSDDTEFAIIIERYVKDKDNPDQPMERSTIISDVFYRIKLDDTSNIETTLRDNLKKKMGVDEDEYILEDMGNKITYVLIKKSDYITARTIVNQVLSGVDLTTAIAYLLSESGVKKVLMSNLDNVDIIPELFLLPMPMLANLIYLETYYGFHKEGTQIFMDLDAMYINRMSGNCTAWRKNEKQQVTFFVSDPTSGESISRGSIETGNAIYVNVDKSAYSTKDNTDIADNIIGQNVVLVNENNTLTEDINTGGSVYSLRTITGHNKYLGNQIRCRKEEAKMVVQLLCTYIDIMSLTPNKKFAIITDDTASINHMKGIYRLSKTSTSFLKDGTHFVGHTMITLKRVRDPNEYDPSSILDIEYDNTDEYYDNSNIEEDE